MEITELLGKTLIAIIVDRNKNEITFICDNGDKYLMFHGQECCEWVYIAEIIGDLRNLIGTPILKAEVKEDSNECITFTFYTLATIKGYVDLRWCGESNGWYSESVDFMKLKESEVEQ